MFVRLYRNSSLASLTLSCAFLTIGIAGSARADAGEKSVVQLYRTADAVCSQGDAERRISLRVASLSVLDARVTRTLDRGQQLASGCYEVQPFVGKTFSRRGWTRIASVSGNGQIQTVSGTAVRQTAGTGGGTMGLVTQTLRFVGIRSPTPDGRREVATGCAVESRTVTARRSAAAVANIRRDIAAGDVARASGPRAITVGDAALANRRGRTEMLQGSDAESKVSHRMSSVTSQHHACNPGQQHCVASLGNGKRRRFSPAAGTVGDGASLRLDVPSGLLIAGPYIGLCIRQNVSKTALHEDTPRASANNQNCPSGTQCGLASPFRAVVHPVDARLTHDITARVESPVALDIPRWSRCARAVDQVAYALLPTTVAAPAARTGMPPPTPDEMLARLYANFPQGVRVPNGPTCIGSACMVRAAAVDAWTGPDGAERRMVVGVAELKDGCHACEAILGLAVFRMAGGTWREEMRNPAVMAVGAYGTFGGTVSFFDGGPLGHMVRLEEVHLHLGVADGFTTLLMPLRGRYRRVLDVRRLHDLTGTCDGEPECRKRVDDGSYTSRVTVSIAHGELCVEQNFAAAHPIPPASWVVSAGGVTR